MDNSRQDNKNQILELNRGARKSSFFFWVEVFLFAVIVDQLSKLYAHKIFYNHAFAFSLPLPTMAIYLIYLVVGGFMLYYVVKHYQEFFLPEAGAWTLIFAGAASNIVERIVTGYVRDFIYISFYRWIGIYNFADFFIISGIVLLLLLPLISEKK